MRLSLLFVCACLGFAGCSTTKVAVRYAPPAAGVKPADAGSPPVGVGNFNDMRGDDANWLGAIRGGFGNPIKTIVAEEPVSKVVQDAFRAGLQARKFTVANDAAVQIAGTIRKLNSIQIARLEANAEIQVRILKMPSGQLIFDKVYAANNLEGSLVTLKAGIFGSTEDLRVVVEKALRDAVDKALDDPELRAALRK